MDAALVAIDDIFVCRLLVASGRSLIVAAGGERD